MKKKQKKYGGKEEEKQAQQNRPEAKSQKRRFASEFIALGHIPILGNEKTAPKLI